MKRTGLVLLLLLTAASIQAQSGTWTIDSTHSAVRFSVQHMMITDVPGSFGKVSGSIVGDPTSPTGAVADITIDATTIDTHSENRDKHLKSADFFDVENHPTITFKSKSIKAAGKNKWKMTGDLTMRGVTKEVVLDVDGPSVIIKDQRGNSRVGSKATGRVSRKDFGLVWNRALDGGGMVLADEVDLVINVALIKKAEEPAPAAPPPAN